MADAPVIIESSGAEAGPLNPRTALMVIASIVVVILLLFFYFYLRGKSSAGPINANLPYDTPSGQQNQNVNTPGASATQTQLTQIAQDMHTDMSGSNWAGHNITPYTQAMALSNTDLIALYNTYNGLYYPQGGGSLVSDLNGEWTTLQSGPWQQAQSVLLTRMQTLTGETVAA